jgi:hypothetical protein
MAPIELDASKVQVNVESDQSMPKLAPTPAKLGNHGASVAPPTTSGTPVASLCTVRTPDAELGVPVARRERRWSTKPPHPLRRRAGDVSNHCAVIVKSTGALVPLAIPFLVPRYWNRNPIIRGIWTMPKFIAASPD